jgi:hypothetical protein
LGIAKSATKKSTTAGTANNANDLSQFDSVIKEFEQALMEDVSIAVRILNNAAAIEAKRVVWSNRKKFRELAGSKLTKNEPKGWKLSEAVELLESYLDTEI